MSDSLTMLQCLRAQQLFSALFLLLSLMAKPVCAEEPTLESAPIGIVGDIHRDYIAFMGSRQVTEITQYSGPYARRDVIELVLLQQALLLGGFDKPLSLVSEVNYFRSIRNVMEGRTISTAGTVWHQDLIDLSAELFITPAIIKKGQFEAGLYTTPQNTQALASTELIDLRKLRVVTSRQWKPDRQTLINLGFERILYTPNWVNMARMLKAKRVDLTLAPFENTPDMHILVEGIELVPIKGIKVTIAGSRHWPVSRKHPQGEAFFNALNKGISIMEKAGTIERAYRECGFFHPAVANWKQL